MSCVACKVAGQFALNFLSMLDHMGNMLLLGDANETISARTARARLAGQKWAVVFCKILTWGAHIVTFGKQKGDHCTLTLDPTIRPISREIWDWNNGRIRTTFRTIIDDEEIPGA